jgi:hypothetical protein
LHDSDAATYSASVVDCDTHFCLLLDQDTRLPLPKKAKPEVEHRESKSPA